MNANLKPVIDRWEDYRQTALQKHRLSPEAEKLFYLTYLMGAAEAARPYRGSAEAMVDFLVTENMRLDPDGRN